MKNNILELINISKTFRKTSFFDRELSSIRALDNVCFSLKKNSVLGIVGESGSGKSTCAKIISKLLEQDNGQVLINGIDHGSLDTRKFSKTVQMVFQDPYSSLNPSLPVAIMLEEAVLELKTKQKRKAVIEMLTEVGLDCGEKLLGSYPHQFSGGQRQRIALARALLKEPEILICDEPFSALDMTTQRQMIDLLENIMAKKHLSILFISHDITVTAEICDRIIVMKDGRIVEAGSPDEILSKPKEEYTKKLLAAVPMVR